MDNPISAGRNDALENAYREYLQNPGEEMMSRLLKAAAPLVRHFALYLGGGRYDGDMVQAGYEGVLKAARDFNPDMKASFATYAGHWIMGEIRHYIRKEMRYYKPRFLDGLQRKAQGLTQQYFEKTGDMPPKSHLAKELNVREEGVDEIFRAGLVSIDSLELDKLNSLKYESFKLPIEDRIVLFEAIRKLSQLKQSIIYCLFFQNRTQQQTADFLGINQRKVSRLLKSSLTDLKELMTK